MTNIEKDGFYYKSVLILILSSSTLDWTNCQIKCCFCKHALIGQSVRILPWFSVNASFD